MLHPLNAKLFFHQFIQFLCIQISQVDIIQVKFNIHEWILFEPAVCQCYPDDLLEIRERAAESFIFDLLPVLDSFDMAFKNKEAWESAPEQWRRGVEYIHTQLKTLLENNQVKIIDPLNKDFDPNEHHSSMNVKIEDKSQEGKVVDVILKGYKIKDRVLRPAHVKVGSFED